MRFMTTKRANKNSAMGARQDLILFSMDMRKTTILLWIVQGLLAVLFLSAGGMKAGRRWWRGCSAATGGGTPLVDPAEHLCKADEPQEQTRQWERHLLRQRVEWLAKHRLRSLRVGL